MQKNKQQTQTKTIKLSKNLKIKPKGSAKLIAPCNLGSGILQIWRLKLA